ncbi:hypothetical protein QVE09_16225 [Paenibacillus sp. ClWae2A]|uniref:hypothetical protein n=1 Tax=Paenibacillus sp. ClWae2A TaxID=3057177 RepID=UPI0028F5AB12|nr:hypothetical protein [Paenibacillus sp. ClWae2A]MDT9720466.1 hypothetical protein [Paenibacillus sp. ClWae2A]
MSNWHYGIPKRENELRAAVKSPVITTQLSPEELEEIRQKYPATKADKAFKKPVEIKSRPKGDNDMAKPKFNLTEEQFNAERASGKTIGRIAEEQGVTEVTVYNHISKWTEARKPGQEKLLREKNVSPPGPPSAELLDKAEKEIERLSMALVETQNERDSLSVEREQLSAENQRLDQRMISAQNEATKAWAEVERLRDKQDESDRQWTKHNEIMQIKNKELDKERDDLIQEINRLNDWIVGLEEQLRQQEPVNAVPDSEVQRLELAIQDLTRARWILNRLSASGE